MKKVFDVFLQILLIFLLCTNFDNVAFCQDSEQESLPGKAIELSQDCQLDLDPTIDMADSLTFEIINGIRDILPKIQALIPADHVTINLAIKSDPRLVLPQLGVGGNLTTCLPKVSSQVNPRAIMIIYTVEIGKDLGIQWFITQKLVQPKMEFPGFQTAGQIGAASSFQASYEVKNSIRSPILD